VVVLDATAQGFDVDPPVIEHDVVVTAEAGERQDFTATVADDNELATVRFLYRFEGERQYTSLEMNRVSASSTFNVVIETDEQSDAAIEYYIEARDESGNRTLRGYNFSPLVRFIELPQPAVEPVAEAAPRKRNLKPLYYVGGALLLGLLAGALAGSGGGGGGEDLPMGTGDCDDGLCDFSITINPPGRP